MVSVNSNMLYQHLTVPNRYLVAKRLTDGQKYFNKVFIVGMQVRWLHMNKQYQLRVKYLL